MSQIIPYGRQNIDASDIKTITRSIKGNYLTTGPKVNIFEKKISNYTKSKYSIVCNSGTSALLLAFLSINLKKDDIVIMPAINFIASYNLCKTLGAKIYLADVNPSSGIMQPSDIEECVKKKQS